MALSSNERFEMPVVDKEFFKALGERVAQRRKELGLTQTELGERIGCSQQTIAVYEAGQRKLPASFLPELSSILDVSVNELLGVPELKPKPGKRGPPSKLEKQLEELKRLPRSKQKFVSEMIETVLAQAS